VLNCGQKAHRMLQLLPLDGEPLGWHIAGTGMHVRVCHLWP